MKKLKVNSAKPRRSQAGTTRAQQRNSTVKPSCSNVDAARARRKRNIAQIGTSVNKNRTRRRNNLGKTIRTDIKKVGPRLKSTFGKYHFPKVNITKKQILSYFAALVHGIGLLKTSVTKLRFKITDFKVILFSLAAIVFLGMFSATSLNLSFSTLMTSFQIPISKVHWLTTGYLLAFAVTSLLSLFIVKRVPTKGLFFVAISTFLAGAILCSIARNFNLLLIARFVMAIGPGISLPLLKYFIREQAPVEQQRHLFVEIGFVVALAPAFGYVLGGIIIHLLDWHWIFILLLPIILLSLVGGLRNMPEIRKEKEATLDFIRFFQNSIFSTGVATLMFTQIIVMAYGFLLPLLIQNGLSYNSAIAGLILLPGAAINGFIGPSLHRFLLKHHTKYFLIPGSLIILTALLFLYFYNYTAALVLIAYLVLMFGSSILQIPAQTLILKQLPKWKEEEGSTLILTLQQVAGAIGTALAAKFLTTESAYYLSVSFRIQAAYLHGIHGCVRFFLVFSLLGIVLAILTRIAINKNGDHLRRRNYFMR